MNCPNCGLALTPDTLGIELKDHGLRTVEYGPRHWRVQYADYEGGAWWDTGPPHETRSAAIVYALGQILKGDFPALH